MSRPLLAVAALLTLAAALGGCAAGPSVPPEARGGASVVEQSGGCTFLAWTDSAEIVRILAAPVDQEVSLGARRGDARMVEFRILGESAPEGSAVLRRSTPFLLTLGTGGLPDAAYVERNGIAPGARFPVRVTEGFPEDRWTRCGSVRILFEGLR